MLTIFGGAPPPGRLWDWDATPPGAFDSATRVRERREENRRAMALTGSTHVELELLEHQYRDAGGGIVTASDLPSLLMSATTVYVPADAGLHGKHPDHATVRDVVREVRPDAVLYADQPYCIFPRDLELVSPADAYEAEVVRLTDDQAVRKARAIAAYAGEVRRLPGLRDRLENPTEEFRFEVIWHLSGRSPS